MLESLSIEALGGDADSQIIQSLLNCILREMSGQIKIEKSSALNAKEVQRLYLSLPETEREVCFEVGSECSLSGTYEYRGASFFRDPRGPDLSWKPLQGFRLAEFLFEELRGQYTSLREPDFLQQIQDSLRVSQLIFQAAPVLKSLRTFQESEQSVTFGHPFHPSPKSRAGFSDEEVCRYSPEFGQGFQLHYFALPSEMLVQKSILEGSVQNLIATDLETQPVNVGGREYFSLPVHPWEARYLLGLKEVQDALQQGTLVDVGRQGREFFSTSSVRTLYSPASAFFYKMSLHVRVTNCIRRNAISEMRSAVELTRILRLFRDSFQLQYSFFHWLEEPGFLTAKLTAAPETEGFGMILRESFVPYLGPEELPLVAAALFGNQARGRYYLKQFVAQSGLSVEDWFDQYLALLLPPVLDLYFKYGLMSEPHLQNILVCLTQGVPTRIFLRDLDNFRLIEGGWGASQNAQEATDLLGDLIFEKSEAWDRFVYCLVVNHLNEAIYSLGNAGQGLEMRLWNLLRAHFSAYAQRSDSFQAKSWVEGLLGASWLPAKGNLVTRFRRSVDRNALYFQIPNPLSRQLSEQRQGA